MATFLRRSAMPVPAGELYAWHARPGAFERLAPPWEHIEVLERQGTIRDGDLLVMRLRRGPLAIRWHAVHEEHVEGEQFVDRQERGPFALWRHRHRFLEADEGSGSILEDDIEYRLPLDPVAQALAGGRVRADLQRMFGFRHRRTRRDLERHRGFAPRRIGVTGAASHLGRALAGFLGGGGHEVVSLVPWAAADGAWVAAGARAGASRDIVELETARLGIDPGLAAGLDAVVHLAGGHGRAPGRRATRSTRRLAEGLAGVPEGPRHLLVLSSLAAHDPDSVETVREGDPAGDGAGARHWVAREAATATAREAGLRVAVLRAGAIMTATGGPLATLLRAHRLGLPGRSALSGAPATWIGLDDLLGAILWTLHRPALDGVLHLAASAPLGADELARALRAVAGGGGWLPLPAALTRLALGDTVRVLRAHRVRVAPGRLMTSGFEVLDPDLESLLRFELGRPVGGLDGTP